jgi:hypothetical protein
VITRTPIMRLAVHFDSASEISAPPKPKIAAKHQQSARAAARQAHAEHLLDDEKHHTQQGQYGQVGDDEQENALHKPFLWEN